MQNQFIAQAGRISVPPAFKVSLTDTIFTMVTYVALLSSIVFFLYIAWGSYEWITASSDKAALEQARKRITTAVIGIIIIGSAYLVYYFVRSLTIGNFGNFQFILQ